MSFKNDSPYCMNDFLKQFLFLRVNGGRKELDRERDK